jgi:hypothetical protein
MPTGAMATAPVSVVPFDQARLTDTVRGIATTVASRYVVSKGTLVAVSPTANQLSYAGVFVGRDARGNDVVAPYNAEGVMGFASVDRIAAYGGVMAFPSASGEAGEVKEVSLVGISEPRVSEVVIKLADGSSLRAELVGAGERGFRFFAYVADSKSRFPVAYAAYGADGEPIKSENLADALAPPAEVVG